jgi:6-phosphogluconolactonase
MPDPDVHIFAGLEELSSAAADLFLELARARGGEGQTFSAALSGGATPKRLYELLAAPPRSTEIPWERVHLFQVDERCVPPDNPQSNYRMIRDVLLRHVPIPEANFHRMAAEQADRDEAAHQYADELARILPPAPGEFPRLDLVFLGMGPDGHTASLFPGTDALEEETLWVRLNFVEKLEVHRLTLTLPVLNAARRIVFLVSGAEKAETLRRVLEADGEELPSQRIRPVEGEVSWFVDKAAARLLEEKRG